MKRDYMATAYQAGSYACLVGGGALANSGKIWLALAAILIGHFCHHASAYFNDLSK